jgi:pSer/pThr/pTyr-binding forkhead associated (FHA) protein
LLIRAKLAQAHSDTGADATVERALEVPFDGDEIVIGRGPGPGVELPFPQVSVRHARIFRDASGLRVEDLGSANGTWLGPRRLLARVPEWLATGDALRVADVVVTLAGEIASTSEQPSPRSSATFARCLIQDLFAASPPAEATRLVVLGGVCDGRELPLSTAGRSIKVGRGDSCDLILPDDDVSREHAAFEIGIDGVYVRDLGSKNGVEVAGQLIEGPSRLRDGDIVRIGETRVRLLDPIDRYLRQVQAADALAPMPAPSPSSVAVPGAIDARTIEPRRAEIASRETVTRTQAVVAAPSDSAIHVTKSHLPVLASTVACAVLLLLLGVVLALAFAA